MVESFVQLQGLGPKGTSFSMLTQFSEEFDLLVMFNLLYIKQVLYNACMKKSFKSKNPIYPFNEGI